MATSDIATESRHQSAVELARRAMHLLAARQLAPTPENFRRAWIDAGGRDDHAARAVIAPPAARPPASSGAADEPARDPLGDELSALAIEICESLVAVAEAQQWSQTLVDTVRSALLRPVRAEVVQTAARMLRQVRSEQSDLSVSRQACAESMQHVLGEYRDWIGNLDSSADRLRQQLDRGVDDIQVCASLDEARGIMQSLAQQTTSVCGEITSSRARMEEAALRAEALQIRVAQLEASLADASRQMLIDELTGAFNRRGLEQEFARLGDASPMQDAALSLALIDLDDFKRLNDELGHRAGDQALRHLCVELRDELRGEGLIARYGGEEFVLVFMGHALEAATARVVAMQARLGERPLMACRTPRVIRFSAGVTARLAGDTLQRMLERADEALYRAKRAGKNCVRRA